MSFGTEIKPFDVNEIRKEFPILNRTVNNHPLVYLDNAASSQKPEFVLNKIDFYYRHLNANVHRGVHQLSQEATDAFEQARQQIAKFIGAKSDAEVIFTRGTTESINLVAYTFGMSQLKEGDEIILSALEHHSNIVPWQMICALKGAHIKVIPVFDDGSLDINWLAKAINDKTKLVAVAHVSNVLGTINPVQQIIQIAHQHGVPVLLDGAQATPHMVIDVSALDVDFYVFSSHKMYGPTGIGILYGKSSWLNILPPWQGGGEMIDQVKWSGTSYNKIPFKYEAGTPDIAGAIGLASACEYISSFDRGAVIQYEQLLLNTCTQAMGTLPGVIPVGQSPEKASVYSFNIRGLHPYDVGSILDQQGIAVRTGHHCTQPLMDRFQIPGTVRASFAMYNTVEEIEQLVKATHKAIKILS
ncbi:MAG: cysteine desulfurase [Saprospiraceae bacterium]|uniref:Cysteine desulfurase n=1 Tax=Candidatus Opimibacter skivensis TaxID=2982028 RepID=A0A9D7XLS3_9BACT|nr:cysteine desulfurase [Candidatus Opimibacter skivensis]